MQRFFIVCGALILIAAAIPFAIHVWPTKYRYDRIRLGEGYEFPVRIHRVTGDAERLTPSEGWRPLHPVRRSAEDILGIPVDLFGRPITATPTPARSR
jgi:hypothetical protein